jgi:hypothetical protein
MMVNLDVHNIAKITARTCAFRANGAVKFNVTTVEITDAKGNETTIKLFSDDRAALIFNLLPDEVSE